MFESLLIHPRTKAQLLRFVSNPSHGLILIGTEGSGKKTISKAVAAAILNQENSKLDGYPYYSVVNPEDPSITIDEIRSLQRLLMLRTPEIKGQSIRRILTIINAGRMRFEAQNAFLKSLEEPPADTCIILTAEANGDLLDTIYSRVQRIDVLPVSEAMAKAYFTQKGVSEAEIKRNYALSQGQIGLLSSLLDAEATHPLKYWVDTAKTLLAKPAGERILETDILAKDKNGVVLLLNAFGRIAHAALTHASRADNMPSVIRWKQCLESVSEAREAMTHNANLKLLLDHLLLSI